MTDAATHLNTPDSTEFRLRVNFRKINRIHGLVVSMQYRAIPTPRLGHEAERRVTDVTSLRGLDELRATHGAEDMHRILRRIAPTERARTQFADAERLIGALYGPNRQRVWMTTELSALRCTPLEYLDDVGPGGWTRILSILKGLMQGGADSSQADRDWATERLAGHRLQIRR